MNNIITEYIRGFEIKFKTRPGVFSEKGLDLGTKLLIDNLEIPNGSLVVDLGCGTGVIGFVAAKLNPKGHVHLLDDSLRVIELAKENATSNNFKNVEVYLSDLFSSVQERTYHQIYCNPPQDMGNEFLEELVSECHRHLKENGEVYLVVQNHIKPVIERIFQKYFGNSTIVAQGRIHIVLKAIKQ
ncbi:class I SAM-dependent methyltransferase [Candidatus Daviesbacteria bacterium]|nr:class I SAM-dependent methyltransferase [Candidatus Daviesbacteria bacterium]